MTDVIVRPMPEKYRKTPGYLRPTHPPIYQNVGTEGITDDDRKLAQELIDLLDDEGKRWYLGPRWEKGEKP